MMQMSVFEYIILTTMSFFIAIGIHIGLWSGRPVWGGAMFLLVSWLMYEFVSLLENGSL